MIVGFPAGGLTDVLARAYGEQLGQKLGQTFIVENKPGAGSMIACAEVAKAAPDGYTFLFTISTAINQSRVLFSACARSPGRRRSSRNSTARSARNGSPLRASWA